MIFRISGNQGSGKTTMAKNLAEELGYRFSYTGGIFREMAAEAGLHLEPFYEKMKGSPELEKSVDLRQGALMQSVKDLVVDGRVAPFQKAAFFTRNIFLKVDRMEGARRQQKRKENEGRTVEAIAAATDTRIASERDRYFHLHGIENHMDESKFDLVLDTTRLSEREVRVLCLAYAKYWISLT